MVKATANIALGKISLMRMRVLDAPIERAASTNSRSRIEIVCALMMREYAGIDKTTSAPLIDKMLGLKTAMIVINKMSGGNANVELTKMFRM